MWRLILILFLVLYPKIGLAQEKIINIGDGFYEKNLFSDTEELFMNFSFDNTIKLSKFLLLSQNMQAFASSGNPYLANDNDYSTQWRGSENISTTPSWIAYNLSSIQPEFKKNLIVHWSNRETYNFDYTRLNDQYTYNLPDSYIIQGSIDNSTWSNILEITGNTLKSRQHIINFEGYNYLKMLITKGSPKNQAQNINASFNLDIFSYQEPNDNFTILGDSISAGCFLSGLISQDVFNSTKHFPIVENYSIGGITTNDVLTQKSNNESWLEYWLKNNNSKFIIVQLGTNDAAQNISLDQFYKNYESIVKTILRLNKIPIIGQIPWSSSITKIETYNGQIEKLKSIYPQILDGANYYSLLKDKPELLRDGIHPNETGNILLRKELSLVIKKLYGIPFDSGDSDDTPCPPCPPCEDRKSLKVNGRFLYDHSGSKIILRGINHMTIWENYGISSDGLPAFDEIEKTGANSIRIVWSFKNGANYQELDRAITNAANRKMIPIIELHDMTCKYDELGYQELISFWTNPKIIEVIKKHEKYLILNIANEMFGFNSNKNTVLNTYKDAISKIRANGVIVPLMIDSTSCGQDMAIIQSIGHELIDFDPLHNLIFSWHPWKSSGTQGELIEEIKKTIADNVKTNLPFIIGEFAANGVVNCSEEIPYKTILEESNINQIGWLAWSWALPSNTPCSQHDISDTYDNLVNKPSDFWGKNVVLDSDFGIKKTSVKNLKIFE